jgi:hypothetical protein
VAEQQSGYAGVRHRLRPTANARADRELEHWIDGELDFYVKGFIADRDFVILRNNLIRIAQAERRRRG